MKKLASVFLIFTLVLLSLTACNKVTKIHKESWRLTSVYHGEEEIKLNGVLTAENGELSFTDTTNGTLYMGTYSNRDEFSPTAADYRITLERAKGRAVISIGENANGKTITTLTLLLGDYTLTFAPEEKK